jgi:CelD/BcsL family acetyltransferase involved in cellulose biosynthesis
MAYKVEIINGLDAFRKLRENWEKVYAQDVHAMFYVSWDYLHAWFQTTTDPWFIYAVRHENEGHYIGFFPLQRRDSYKGGKRVYTLLTAATNPMPVYTGFVCLPDSLDIFASALAGHLKKSNDWDKLFLSNVIDPKMERLLENWGSKRFIIQKNEVIPALRLDLPANFEDYLNHNFTRSRRYNLRFILRKVKDDPDLKISSVTEESVENDVETLVDLWNQRWKKDDLALFEKEMLLRLYKSGHVWLNILWHKEKPVAVLSFFTDRVRSVVYAHITAYDRDYSSLSPGKVLFIYGIRHSIDEKYSHFDFAQGLDEYKQMLNADKYQIYSYKILPRNLRSLLLRVLQGLRPSR